MRSVKEVSKLAGVSVRTLHYYDAIGLLKPAKTTEAGYRLYDDAALSRLRSILLFRELQFPLKEIRAMLDNPAFSQKKALEQQIALLEKKKSRMEALISFAKKIQTEGESIMEFDIFRQDDFRQYAEEVRQKWARPALTGNTSKNGRRGRICKARQRACWMCSRKLEHCGISRLTERRRRRKSAHCKRLSQSISTPATNRSCAGWASFISAMRA